MSVQNICVVHLVRSCNDIESFVSFIESYKSFSSGIKHDLLIVFKGFSSTNTDISPYKNILDAIEYKEFFVSDEGFDITAYFKVMSAYQYDAYCFLNSHSRILANDWLVKFHNALLQENVGLVGATGSYQSMYTDQLSPGVSFPSASGWPFSVWKRNLIRIIQFLYRVSDFIKRWVFFTINFHPFPNPHIRTNAFMVSRSVMSELRFPNIQTKMEAWLFESGKRGLTCSVKKLGKRVLVVGRNGQFYEEEQWVNSQTYKQRDQENLLIADNQTEVYQLGDLEVRKMHANYAWGREDAALIER